MGEESEKLNIGELSDESFLFKEVSWKIPLEKILPNLVDQDVRSPSFPFAGANWILHIYPYGRATSSSAGWIELVIKRLDSKIPQHYIYYKFYFKTFQGNEFSPLQATYVFNAKCKGGWLLYMKKDNFFLNQKVLAIKNCIVIGCEMRTQKIAGIEMFSQTESVKSIIDCKGVPRNLVLLPSDKMIHDFKELFLKQEDCDVVINVKGREFPAHRNILRARSPVFASTFRNDMTEKATGVVNIEDCDPTSFSDFLHFLYCGHVENLSTENVFSLFTTADKYDVQDLRSKCLDFMKKNLSVDTFCDTATLALRHCERELIELTTEFFGKNFQEIIVTVKWQSFLVENPIQGNEIMIKALVSKK